MIYSSEKNTYYWIPVASIITAFVISTAVVYLLLNDPADILFQPVILILLILFPIVAALKVLLEIRLIYRSENELFVGGVFKKNQYAINNSVIAVTSTGREKTIGLYNRMHDNQKIVDGLLTIAGAEKKAKQLSKYLQIPYGETDMFKKLKSMGLYK